MKRFAALFSVALICTAAVAGPLQRQFEAMNQKIAKCLFNRDMDGFNKLVKPMVTADFKHIENGQTMNYDQMLAQMKVGVGMMTKMTKCEAKIITFNQKGNTVLTQENHTMIGTMVGADKKPHTMGFTGLTSNTYRKEGGRWKLAIMKWTKETMTMDGKPMDPSKMGG